MSDGNKHIKSRSSKKAAMSNNSASTWRVASNQSGGIEKQKRGHERWRRKRWRNRRGGIVANISIESVISVMPSEGGGNDVAASRNGVSNWRNGVA